MIWLATPKTLPEYMIFYTSLAPRGISWSLSLESTGLPTGTYEARSVRRTIGTQGQI
jgi:hypothetical protein